MLLTTGARAEWKRVEITSDSIAVRGGVLLGVAALSVPMPGGEHIQAQITYWKWNGSIYRCHDSIYRGYQSCEKAVESQPSTTADSSREAQS